MRFLILYASSLIALAGLSFTLIGCPTETNETVTDGGSDGPIGCKLEYVGDQNAPIEMQVVTLDPSYAAQPFMDGGNASILVPPQGGRVIFLGVKAKNLDPCGVKLAGAIRDPSTMATQLDTRTINLDPTADGWGQSDPTDISSFSNVPVCGNGWASTDIYDQTFKMLLSVTDRSGKKASVTYDVVPKCDEVKIDNGQDVQKDCLCICKQGYVTGQTCNPQ